MSVIDQHDPSNQDHQKAAMDELKEMEDLHDSPNYQFILDQLQLMLKPPSGRRYTKHTLVFAAELLGISPAGYRVLRRSKTNYSTSKRND
jgi:hypothetical protein